MPEEKSAEYQIIAYRCDLVTIPISEYKELLVTGERSTAKADKWLSDWCKERERADKLSAEVEKLKAEVDDLRIQVRQLKAKPTNSEVGHHA